MSAEMVVRFWGVRGSIASPGPETMRYGANTPCVELRCGEHRLVCDAGTGLRPLGLALEAEGVKGPIDLFLTHTHIDHICGFPFFAPCLRPGHYIRVWAGHEAAAGDIRAAMLKSMTPPLFPDVMETFAARIEFENFRAGQTLAPHADVMVRTAPLQHPGGATGYRIEWQGRAVAYVTDTEHRAGTLDPAVLTLAQQADALIYDANYTDEDYADHIGWGHSTWQEGVRVARAAGVKRLVLFHHDPARSDEMLDRIAAAAQAALPGTIVASEGLVLRF